MDMKRTWKQPKALYLILFVFLSAGCESLIPYIPPPLEPYGTPEKKAPDKELAGKEIGDKKIQDTNVHEKETKERIPAEGGPLQRDAVIKEAAIQKEPENLNHAETYTTKTGKPSYEVVPHRLPDGEAGAAPPPATENGPRSNQQLIDSALDYIQASNDFWEQGDLDNAIDALDKAYSLILKINGAEEPEVLQQKEDLRLTIASRIREVHSSRFTAANGDYKAIPLVMNRHVEKALNLLKGKERTFFLESYARSGKYRPAIVRALREAGLPSELSWLPLIESGYKVRALSRARALGMWQFIASTGYKFGLKRDTWIDERMDPEKSTQAAIRYLTELHQIFGDWSTVLASYNCGERRVLRHIKAQRINYLDNFWDLYEKLPRETAFYVPKFLAVLHILNDPQAHGFDLPPLEEEVKLEEVTISKQIQLKTVSDRIDVEYSLLKELNPELRRNLTPKTPYALKVPRGKGEILLAKLEDIPAWRPPVPDYVVHRVRSGESLSVIASRYKTSVRGIMNMNGLKRRDYLKVGWRLKIPTKKGYATADKSSLSYTSSGELTKYSVKKGDSLWKIANRFNTTVKAIRTVNQLGSTNLQIGQVLRIPAGTSSEEPGATHKYTVKKGDSPYLIARRYRMNLYEFLKLNDLTPRSTIFPGQIVQVIAE